MSYTKLNSKLTKEKHKTKAINLLEENTGEMFQKSIVNNEFSDMTPKHRQQKQK
jgi:hypothetical protein